MGKRLARYRRFELAEQYNRCMLCGYPVAPEDVQIIKPLLLCIHKHEFPRVEDAWQDRTITEHGHHKKRYIVWKSLGLD